VIDFLNVCVFCFVVAGVIGLITGHEDGPALALLAIVVVAFRLVPEIPAIGDWVRGRVRRDG